LVERAQTPAPEWSQMAGWSVPMLGLLAGGKTPNILIETA
jgi:hypothetical protein